MIEALKSAAATRTTTPIPTASLMELCAQDSVREYVDELIDDDVALQEEEGTQFDLYDDRAYASTELASLKELKHS